VKQTHDVRQIEALCILSVISSNLNHALLRLFTGITVYNSPVKCTVYSTFTACLYSV